MYFSGKYEQTPAKLCEMGLHRLEADGENINK